MWMVYKNKLVIVHLKKKLKFKTVGLKLFEL